MIDAESMLLAALLIAGLLGCIQIALLGRVTGWWRLFRPSRRQRREGEA